MIRLSSKKILISTCLLLVLASSIMTQIAGQSTMSVAVCFDLVNQRLQVLINDEPFYINLSDFETPDEGDSIQLIGDVYEGTYDNPGKLIGAFTGARALFTDTPTFESGSLEEFTVVLNFTVSGTPYGILHVESKFTGNLLEDTEITLEIVESEYAYMESNGVRVNLRFIGLEPESGVVTFDEGNGIICLPTFIFLIEPPVAGIVIPIDKLAVLTPYLALAGLIAAVSTVYVFKRRKD